MAGLNAERKDTVTRGTGNVFADLGFPDAAERQAKLRLCPQSGVARAQARGWLQRSATNGIRRCRHQSAYPDATTS